jgi:hypothetical protein
MLAVSGPCPSSAPQHNVQNLALMCRELQRRMQQAEEDSVEATPSGGATWDSIRKVIVIGVGSLEASQPARYQLALALLLAEGFEALQEAVQVHDPILTDLDKEILGEIKCQVRVSNSCIASSMKSAPAVPHPEMLTTYFKLL